MKKVFIIHGFHSSPNGGWRPWLMAELAKQDIYACALAMPNPNKPDPIEWVNEISRHVEANKRDQVYLIGHSLGVPTILRHLESTSAKSVKGAVLVSGPVFKTTKKAVAKFLEKPFEFQKIKSNSRKFVVIHGSNDMNVSLDQGETLAKELRAKLIIIKGGGHLNGSAGWLKLPQCLSALNDLMGDEIPDRDAQPKATMS